MLNLRRDRAVGFIDLWTRSREVIGSVEDYPSVVRYDRKCDTPAVT